MQGYVHLSIPHPMGKRVIETFSSAKRHMQGNKLLPKWVVPEKWDDSPAGKNDWMPAAAEFVILDNRSCVSVSAEELRDARIVFTDGGLLRFSPSPFGGTWGWLAVDSGNQRIGQGSGIILREEIRKLGVDSLTECNQTEFLAVLMAFRSLPDGWSGYLATDSQNTIGRIFQSWKLNNLPQSWIDDMTVEKERLGKIWPLKLKGHPTVKDIQRGHTVTGKLVSEHNVYVDALCTAQAELYWANEGQEHVNYNYKA